MILHLNLPQNAYDIILERGALSRAGEYLRLDRRVLIVTDDGVPAEYAQAVAQACLHPTVVTLPAGEGSKSLAAFDHLLGVMTQNEFTRTDCVVAVGGGVIGDLAGFAAASYLRGIDFYNIPTTLLSQVDSSIGGKVAVNFRGVKNLVGAFYQPKRVLIDADVLKTLPRRQLANGFSEALKMSMTCDAELFSIFENGLAEEQIDTVIERSLRIKASVVERDERETGLRRVLNFGHTLGHGIEAAEELHGLYHGECVALGMIPMCAPDVRARLLVALRALGLPTSLEMDTEQALAFASHDKKRDGDSISVIWVERVGSFEEKRMPLDVWKQQIRKTVQEELR
ncbi:MAG: 3-dehydroquinate synthase [Clostridia bacterium]|nr:3-dehydroquinate synthase [Clostridia bacterium]